MLDETQALAGGQGAELGPQTERSTMPTPRDVILAALATRLPCPVCGRSVECRCARPEGYSPTAARAELVEAALLEHGHLPTPQREVTDEDIEAAARWLAGQSRHPRYVDVEGGWRKLLESDVDVDLAHHHAALSAPQSDQQAVDEARTLLLGFGAARRASGAGA